MALEGLLGRAGARGRVVGRQGEQAGMARHGGVGDQDAGPPSTQHRRNRESGQGDPHKFQRENSHGAVRWGPQHGRGQGVGAKIWGQEVEIPPKVTVAGQHHREAPGPWHGCLTGPPSSQSTLFLPKQLGDGENERKSQDNCSSPR